ncbi:MAG: shikimate kinase [Cyanobacteria bacterium]|nr:shikimate kinase [Cyanobacteriota bacterium]
MTLETEMTESSDRALRLYLTGYMGAGKSTIGRALAENLSYKFIDTDRQLVLHFHRPISEIFRHHGESAFREAELNCLKGLSNQERVVISTGGGTLTRDETMQVAKQSGLVIYLEAPVDVLYERVIFSPKDRPMIDVPDPEAVFKERFLRREPYYLQADMTVNCAHKPPKQVALDIIEALKPFQNQALSPQDQTAREQNPTDVTPLS